MTTTIQGCPSKTQVNKAGHVLRAWQLAENLDPQAYGKAYDILAAL
jgi:hypothetical protein